MSKTHEISHIIRNMLINKTDCGDKVYAHNADGEKLPNIVFIRDKWTVIPYKLEYSVESEVRINVASKDYDETSKVINQICDAIKNVNEDVISIDLQGGTESYDVDMRIYMQELNLIIKH